MYRCSVIVCYTLWIFPFLLLIPLDCSLGKQSRIRNTIGIRRFYGWQVGAYMRVFELQGTWKCFQSVSLCMCVWERERERVLIHIKRSSLHLYILYFLFFFVRKAALFPLTPSFPAKCMKITYGSYQAD